MHFTRPESRMIGLAYRDGLDIEHAILKLHFGRGMLTSVLAATWRIFPEASDHRLTELWSKKAITKTALKWQRTLETYAHTHAIVTAMCTLGLHYIFASFLKQILTIPERTSEPEELKGLFQGNKNVLTKNSLCLNKIITTFRLILLSHKNRTLTVILCLWLSHTSNLTSISPTFMKLSTSFLLQVFPAFINPNFN